jgi:hypothetical protein
VRHDSAPPPPAAGDDDQRYVTWSIVVSVSLHAVLLLMPWPEPRELAYPWSSRQPADPMQSIFPLPTTTIPKLTGPSESEVDASRSTKPTLEEPPEFAGALRAGLDVPAPEVLFRVLPEYPSQAALCRVNGTVVLRLLIDEEGSVADCLFCAVVRVAWPSQRSMRYGSGGSHRPWFVVNSCVSSTTSPCGSY